MKTVLITLIAAEMTLLISSTTQADVRGSPKISIASLYGTWGDATGRQVYKYSIGPHWIAYFNRNCGYRYRYRLTKSEIVSFQGEKSWEINLEEFEPAFLGKNLTAQECLGHELPKKAYVNIGASVAAVEVEAPSQGPISLTECATEEDLKGLLIPHSDENRPHCAGPANTAAGGMQSRAP
jgi:hypothetical protein